MAAGDIVLSNSRVKTWRRCPRKFHYKYVQRLEKKTRALPLTRGDWLHQMLMTHYDGEDWMDRWKELSKEFHAMFDEEKEELGDLPAETKRIMLSYVKRWARQDAQYTVIDSELDETITLPTGDKFRFIIDLIVEEDDGGIWLWDHKTVSKFIDADFMLLDTQLARYFWCAEKMGYKPLRGVMFNEIRTKPPTVPRLLVRGGLSQAKNIDTDYYTYAREILRLGLDPAPYAGTLRRLKRNTGKFFRRTILPADKALTKRQMRELVMSRREIDNAYERDEWPRSASKDCLYDCEFKNICIAQLMGAPNVDAMIKSGFRTRPRRKD